MSFGQDPSYFAARGATATAREIAQQGDCWRQIPTLLAAADPALKAKLREALHILDEQSAQTPPSGIKPGFPTRGTTAQEGTP